MHDYRSQYSQGDTLASAAGEVCRRLRPNGDASEAEWSIAREREIGELVEWAKQCDRIISAAEVEGLPYYRGGMEHEVWHNELDGRWYKLTHSNEFGRFPELTYDLDKISQEWITSVVLRIATPAEYLQRLLLGREVFGDDVMLEGVVIGDNGVSILISQAHIVGKSPKLRELYAFMYKAGFYAVPNFAWYKPSESIAAFDAQIRNFLRAGREIIPIDLIMTRVEGGLEEYLNINCRLPH